MIGSDFESFIRTEHGVVPARMDMPLGDKHGNHIPLNNGTMHRDNVMVELCTSAHKDAGDFVDSVDALLEEAQDAIRPICGHIDASLDLSPTYLFRTHMLDHPAAREVGCDQDYLSAGYMSVAREPITATTLGNFRFAGGHMHISYACVDKVPPAIAARCCDFVLGAPELLFMDDQRQRRAHYGLASLHRPKQYGGVGGVEYRTLSNAWLYDRQDRYMIAHNALCLERALQETPLAKIGDVWTDIVNKYDMRTLFGQSAPVYWDMVEDAMHAFMDAFPHIPFLREVPR